MEMFIYFDDSSSSLAMIVIRELTSVGCNFERQSSQLVTFVVPPRMGVPFAQLLNYLDENLEKGIIGWEIGKAPADSESAMH